MMPSEPQQVAIFGSTGSIGTQALDVIRSHPDALEVRVLTAWSNAGLLVRQALEFRPECVVIGDESAGAWVREGLSGSGITVLVGTQGLNDAASWPGVDVVLTAVVGAAGLELTLTAISCGRRIALANKETLVVAGDLVTRAAEQKGVSIIPVDSEHSAIYQCLAGEAMEDIRRIVLTASGGPFREWTSDAMKHVTPADALKHPNWDMGAKISIDSATMMNKGLEVIEARWLFNVMSDRIAVVVHPQSVIHSMVEFHDGSTMAQLGPPDMKLPIQYALAFPERWPASRPGVDWSTASSMTFEPPDTGRFPCLRLAFEALDAGPSATAVLNAANEVSVGAFLVGRASFPDIPRINEGVLSRLSGRATTSVADRLALDAEARALAAELMGTRVH
ncbi:MAG: 1-deoxy-D-xylulose-5-phosphate reductoisomerase [Rhodothermales bacterium]